MSNSITILGRFTDNPEAKTTQDNKQIAHFNLADNRGQDQASFFRCTAFGKTAELILASCQKGHRLLVYGRMEEQQWTDGQGQKQRSWQVAVNQIDFIEPKQQAAPPAAPTYAAPPAPTGYAAPPAAPTGYAAPPYGAPPVPNTGYAAPPQAPVPPAPQSPAIPVTQYTTDAAGNQYQLINNQWQMVKAAAPAAPGAPVSHPSNIPTPF